MNGPTPVEHVAGVQSPNGRRGTIEADEGARSMDVYSINDAGIEKRPVAALKLLLEQPDALIWVDVPSCQAEQAAVLSEVVEFHDLAIRDCVGGTTSSISKIGWASACPHEPLRSMPTMRPSSTIEPRSLLREVGSGAAHVRVGVRAEVRTVDVGRQFA